VLVAHAAIDADRFEAEGFMKADASEVRQGDTRIGVAESLESEDLEQGGIQGAPHPGAAHLLVDVDRHVDRPLVGGAGPMATRIRVAQDLIATFDDQPWVLLEGFGHARPHLLDGGHVDLERCGGIAHDRGVNRLDRGCVLRRGETERGGH